MPNLINIAIVDDHSLFRKSLGVLIDLFPKYRVVCNAANGKDFIEQLNTKLLPDIVLMDISMPVMDGYVTTAWLSANYPHMKVLALSTMDSEAAIIKMIRNGASGYLLKDTEPEELKRAFEDVLTRGYFYNEMISHKVLKNINHLANLGNPIGDFIKLSEREIEFLKLTCTELTYKEIADQFFVSVRTVEGYRDNLCDKLNLKTRVGLVMYAIKQGLVNP